MLCDQSVILGGNLIPAFSLALNNEELILHMPGYLLEIVNERSEANSTQKNINSWICYPEESFYGGDVISLFWFIK